MQTVEEVSDHSSRKLQDDILCFVKALRIWAKLPNFVLLIILLRNLFAS